MTSIRARTDTIRKSPFRQSVEASMAGEDLEAYADDYPELATALER
ncbi:hypothetical protein [Natrinema sp. SYSU A 869]|nr:hypothetical protein [Natrinema sp. SYSU A 869]